MNKRSKNTELVEFPYRTCGKASLKIIHTSFKKWCKSLALDEIKADIIYSAKGTCEAFYDSAACGTG